MTNTLTIETSGLTCSVAIKTPIIEKHKILAEPRSHGKVLLPYISELLNDAGIQVKDINTIGISIGPGSFTGLRIGFAITQGLAYSNKIPVVPISSLEGMIHSFCSQSNLPNTFENIKKSIVVVTDAKMGHLNFGHYRVNGLEAETILKDRLIEISRVEHLILSLKPELILVDNLSYFSKFKIDFENTFEVHSRAQDLIRVTEYRHQIGLSEDVKDLELSYLREADAWKKNRHP